MGAEVDLIQAAVEAGQTALNEHQSKLALAGRGLPVCREELAATRDQAVQAAGRMGYPVALKACSWRLMHKSEAGGVALNLADAEAVGRAYDQLTADATLPLDGVLVQEMLKGPRELMLGLTRDAQFGPCVMLGLGGVMAEALDDTVFRVAPISVADAREMAEELRTAKLLGPFRGQAPADLDGLIKALMAVSRLGNENPAVAEIDVNPLIIGPDGRVAAADALVVLDGGSHD